MRFQLAVLGLFGMLAAIARADDITVKLAVRDDGFEPSQLEVPAGTRVRLEINNQSTAAIEFESFELNRERVVQPGQTAAVYLVGLEAGRYEFFDDFHQQRKGTIIAK